MRPHGCFGPLWPSSCLRSERGCCLAALAPEGLERPGRTRLTRRFELRAGPRKLAIPTEHDSDAQGRRGVGADEREKAAVGRDVEGVILAVWQLDVEERLHRAGFEIGAAHVGWKGALSGILEATIAAMEGMGAARARIHAALGPLIRQQSYEVGPEFVARFLAADAHDAKFFSGAKAVGRVMFDLPGYIVSRLERAQVGRIEDLGRCTYAEPENFFSYRRATHRSEPDYGRHVSAIALAG